MSMVPLAFLALMPVPSPPVKPAATVPVRRQERRPIWLAARAVVAITASPCLDTSKFALPPFTVIAGTMRFSLKNKSPTADVALLANPRPGGEDLRAQRRLLCCAIGVRYRRVVVGHFVNLVTQSLQETLLVHPGRNRDRVRDSPGGVKVSGFIVDAGDRKSDLPAGMR